MRAFHNKLTGETKREREKKGEKQKYNQDLCVEETSEVVSKLTKNFVIFFIYLCFKQSYQNICHRKQIQTLFLNYTAKFENAQEILKY